MHKIKINSSLNQLLRSYKQLDLVFYAYQILIADDNWLMLYKSKFLLKERKKILLHTFQNGKIFKKKPPTQTVEADFYQNISCL